MSGKRKYSDEFRLKAVQMYLSGRHGGFKTIAKELGIDHSDLRRWVHLYDQHGVEGLTKVSGTYSGEFKIHVVEYMHRNQMSLKEAANYFCLPNHCTLSKWEQIYYEEGREALLEERRGRNKMGRKTPPNPKKNTNENEELLAEVRRLRMENEYLKKLNALVLEREKPEQKKK